MDTVNPDPTNNANDDVKLQNYQDDLDTSSSIHDPLMHELNDDPTEELQVDPKQFKRELDHYDFGNGTNGGQATDGDDDADEDDRREQLEDMDQDVAAGNSNN